MTSVTEGSPNLIEGHPIWNGLGPWKWKFAPACCCHESLFRCITCQDARVQRSQTTNASCRNLKWTVADLLSCYSSSFELIVQITAGLHEISGLVLSSQLVVSSSRTVRPCSPGVRWIEHWRTTWSTVCCSAPHSEVAEEAIPHLCRLEWKTFNTGA